MNGATTVNHSDDDPSDPILRSLTQDQLDVLEASLTNDENSSDEDLCQYFVAEIGLTDAQANQALTYRPLYLLNSYLSGSGPIFEGEHAVTMEMQMGTASAPRKPR